MDYELRKRKVLGKTLFLILSFIVFAMFFWYKNTIIIKLEEKNKELKSLLINNGIEIPQKDSSSKNIKEEEIHNNNGNFVVIDNKDKISTKDFLLFK